MRRPNKQDLARVAEKIGDADQKPIWQLQLWEDDPRGLVATVPHLTHAEAVGLFARLDLGCRGFTLLCLNGCLPTRWKTRDEEGDK